MFRDRATIVHVAHHGFASFRKVFGYPSFLFAIFLVHSRRDPYRRVQKRRREHCLGIVAESYDCGVIYLLNMHDFGITGFFHTQRMSISI